MARLSFRKARMFDVLPLVTIEQKAFAHPWSAEQLANDIISNPNAYVGVAELGSVIVGYADMLMVAGEAQLFNIVVDPDYQGHHIGEKLLWYMMRVAVQNCDTVTLEVRRSNVPALQLYRKAGFREVGVRKGYYQNNGEDAILMDKNLSDDKNLDGKIEFEVDLAEAPEIEVELAEASETERESNGPEGELPELDIEIL